jgi:Flp pilus assembly protein TadG
MRRSAWTLWGNADGAVAPTVALSLTALIAAGGIAFDYARMASMDTELQSAADQAALAAAAQLDGEDGACERAVAAARSMVAHQTKMANDNGGLAVTIADPGVCNSDTTITFNANASIRFYQDKDKTQESDDDSNAKFVEVQVADRRANYALTPIAAAFNSGDMSAIAFAGLDSAICKVPPLMLCNPNETDDPDFTIANYIGVGIRLIANDGGGTYGPGNFGFLDVGAGNGASTLKQELGQLNHPGDCVSGDGVTTETGSIISTRDALNTRFGVYDQGLNNPCGGNGSALCPPSANIRQDLVLRGNGNTIQKLQFAGNLTGNQNGWVQGANPYPGTVLNPVDCDRNSPNNCYGWTSSVPVGAHALSDAELPASGTNALPPMGYPRDICHSFSVLGSCAKGRIGDGNWDRFAYFKTNSVSYPEVASLTKANTAAFNTLLNGWFGTPTPTRYKVYQWEMANAASRLLSQATPNGGFTAYSNPANLSGEPSPAISPSATQIDRRVLSVAVINCDAEDVSGHTEDVNVKKWIDIFLVEPSVPRVRTENSDVYVEVIGLTQNASNEGAVQLVKKSVPYLIE